MDRTATPIHRLTPQERDNSALFARVDPVVKARYKKATVMLRDRRNRTAEGDRRIENVRWMNLRANRARSTRADVAALSDLLDIPYGELAALCPWLAADGASDDDDSATRAA